MPPFWQPSINLHTTAGVMFTEHFYFKNLLFMLLQLPQFPPFPPPPSPLHTVNPHIVVHVHG